MYGSVFPAGLAVSSAGMMTTGTPNELRSSMNVGTGRFSLIWKVYFSGAAIEATGSRILRSMPTFS